MSRNEPFFDFEGSASGKEELSPVHEGELCTRDHLSIPTVVMLRSAHLAYVIEGSASGKEELSPVKRVSCVRVIIYRYRLSLCSAPHIWPT